MTTKRVLFGLIGKKLGHSFSPGYFSEKFRNEGIDAQYLAFELEHIRNFPDLINEQQALRGLNVTIPYKQAVIPFLDHISPEAKAVGAVNTILISESGELTGYNTDVTGFQEGLKKAWHKSAIDQAVVLGSGGAAQAVLFVLKNWLGVKRPLVVSRSPQAGHIGYPDLRMLQAEDFDLLINTSPIGMHPDFHQAPDFPYSVLNNRHLAYDLIYNPSETMFLTKAKSREQRLKMA
ncbi:MAG: shikimate dehydrogenase [Bacteroidia bacterium]